MWPGIIKDKVMCLFLPVMTLQARYRMWVMSYVNNGASGQVKYLSPYFLLFLLQIALEELVFGIIINTYPCTTIV